MIANIWLSLLATYALCGPTYRTTLKNYEVLRVTAKSHHASVVYEELNSAHDAMFPLSHYTVSRQCVQDSVVTYHTKSLELVEREFAASECRLNVNENYVSVLRPTSGVHQEIQDDYVRLRNPLYTEIEHTIMAKVEDHPRNLDIDFYSFEALNYDLECPVAYFEIAQVKLSQLALEVCLEKSVKIAPSCGFKSLDPTFDGSLTAEERLYIPVNGTFHCVNGRSPTCRRSLAQASNAHYRLPE